MKQNFCDVYFTAFSDFLFKLFGDFYCVKKTRKKSQNFVRMLVINKFL